MLNILDLIFKGEVQPMNTCTTPASNIQGCIGCDGACLYSCDAMCENICLGESVGNSGPGPSCNFACTGTCVNVASILVK